MSDGINIQRGQGPVYQTPIGDTTKVDESKPKEVKSEPPPSPPQQKDKPATTDSSKKMLEHKMNETVLKADLNQKIDIKNAKGETIKAAEKILDNPHLSDAAKISQLQKAIEKSDNTEFAHFMAKYPNFSMDKKALINSAIIESPAIMERVAGELSQSEQLTVVWNGVMDSTRGKTEKEETARQARVDKAVGVWMQKTDAGTLEKALDGKSIDFRASAKLYGTLASDPARLIIKMGAHDSKLMGDQLEIATQLMNAAHIPGRDITRQEIESAAASMIAQNLAKEARLEQMRRPGF